MDLCDTEQLALRGLSMGPPPFGILAGGFTGWGHGVPRGETSDRVGHGIVVGTDWLPEVEMQGVVVVEGDDAEHAGQLRGQLTTAWRSMKRGEVMLAGSLPGWYESVLYRFGRPLGASLNEEDRMLKVQRVGCQFRAHDPLWYGAERDSEHQAGSVTVLEDDAGEVPSDRLTIDILGDGGTPSIENDVSGSISFTGSLGVGQTWTVDVRHSEVSGGGTPASGSTWLRIEPDTDNVFTHSGCASIRVQWRPAY